MTREYLEIRTPENLVIEYELAGIGSRTIAMSIDTMIQLLIMLILVILFSRVDYKYTASVSSNWIIAGNILLIFLNYWGYFVIFEMLMKGRTPGKKIAGLRTIRENGQPITFMNSFIRNLFRVIDYVVGIFFIIFSKRYKRIGDYAAGTVVIKEMKLKKKSKKSARNFTIEQISNKINDSNYVNYIRITNKEYTVLKKFLARKKKMTKDSRVAMTKNLAQYFRNKVQDETLRKMNDEDFIQYVYENNKLTD